MMQECLAIAAAMMLLAYAGTVGDAQAVLPTAGDHGAQEALVPEITRF